MIDNEELKFSLLDELMVNHRLATPSKDFARQVMQRVNKEMPRMPIWEQDWFQWLATAVGLAFAVGRLVSYILSAWAVVELSG